MNENDADPRHGGYGHICDESCLASMVQHEYRCLDCGLFLDLPFAVGTHDALGHRVRRVEILTGAIHGLGSKP
jgi:hypothetical protein